ncbi:MULTISPECIES: nif-specific transcriptional activator NifA [Methylococcus]|uniref:Nif-specific regulatory protein n=1 Tax=Methylococcus capsulatus TaxID=414 RepID=A0ABZ2F202_METCP|nr:MULTISPECIES: nif-specific transcriptional activator NifA [Methylococcus]MDF9391500.1 nif-specific transcriptional activator NifA [Methylococcus capsulatus]
MVDRYTLIERELDALYQVGQVLNSTSDLMGRLEGVLNVLHEQADLRSGMIALREPETGALVLAVLRRGEAGRISDEPVRYEPGEGLIGTILEANCTIMVERIADEPRFLGRLGLYDPELPFIGSPIHVGKDELLGVLAAQPSERELLGERARFLEMVSNLVAQSVGLLRGMEQKQRDLTTQCEQLQQTLRSNYGFENIIGRTPPMMRVFETVRQVAKWNTTVLIRGESGTGKEMIASAIHFNSPRASGPFVKLNCAALPENLLESELFGHEKGAFSGAVSQRKGRFELANHGTLFLDEIGEISPAFQAKLLRVLQEGEFERVGGIHTLKVDVRIIAATNRDLELAVEEGSFREDLYYRLNVMPIQMPPLRQRKEDIPELARFLLGRISRNQGGRSLEIKESAIRSLMRHDWPGNVRELENLLERAAIMSREGVIDSEVIGMTGLKEKLTTPADAASYKVDLDDENLDERERIIAALEQSGWVQAKAARLLDMTPRQIAYRVKILNIHMKHL